MALTFSRSSDSPDERLRIFLCNLDLLTAEGELLRDRRQVQLEEIAVILQQLISDPELAPMADKEIVRDWIDASLLSFTPGERSRAGVSDIIHLCRALVQKKTQILRSDTEEFLGPTEAVSAEASEKIAYLQNKFSDEAFSKLTYRFKNPRAAYASSFTEVCEEVYNGFCEFCILPVESSGDGKLLRFYGLIEKFNLKIVSVCDVEQLDGSYTKYALLRHKFISFHLSKRLCGGHFAEFGLVLNEGVTLSDVLIAAEYCHMRLSRIDSVPLPYKNDAYRYDTVFALPSLADDDESPSADRISLRDMLLDIETFLLYLSVSLPEYTPIGIYTRVS